MLLMVISFLIGWAVGTYVGKLVATYFNNKVSPFAKTEEVTDYDIMKEFDDADK